MKKLNKTTSIIGLLKDDYLLLAIASAEPDYRLAWLLNNGLQIMLQRGISVTVGEGLSLFSLFSTQDDVGAINYVLLANKNHQEGRVLLSDYPTVDYFLKITGISSPKELDELRAKIKNISEIAACIPLVPRKKTAYLFFDNLKN